MVGIIFYEQNIKTNCKMYASSCLNFDWVDSIYDPKRRNQFPTRACRREYNVAAGAGCCLPAPFVAQPFLRYMEPYSYNEFKAREDMQAGPLLNKDGNPVVIADGNVVEIKSNVAGDLRPPNGFLPPPPPPAYCCTKPGETPKCYPPYAQACSPCAITLSCGNGMNGEVCAPGPWFQRKEVYQGATFMPASSMPTLETYPYFDPAAMYVYNTPGEFQRAYDGVVNNHLPAFSKFAFQTEAERLRLQYGIVPPIPTMPPCCGIDIVKPTCQLDRPLQCNGCKAPPIAYNQKYLDGIGDCGCSTPGCRAWVRGSTTRCNTCLGRLSSAPCPCDAPSVNNLYARGNGGETLWNLQQ